jgi:PEP-CTERM motif/PAP2 superfamily
MHKSLHAASVAICLAMASANPANAAVIVTDNPVLYWNQVMLDTLPPSAAVRSYAMVNIAMYDSINATQGYKYKSYLNGVSNPGGSGNAAVVQAAHDVLSSLNPGAAAQYDAALSTSLAQIPDSAAKAKGIITGKAYAAAIVAKRATDGAFDSVTYTPSGLPGRYAPTPPGFASPIFPQWATVTPFLLTSPDQFRASAPPDLTSRAYTNAFNQVKEIGSLTSSIRTADQTAAAQFWSTANGSTYMRLALEISADEGLSTFQNARLFALLGTGIADTLITLWDTKYHYDFWRPITAIQNADLDGNPLTDADTGWQSLINAPPHPSYVSAHSALGAITTDILLKTIGDEAFCSTIGANSRCWSSLNAISLDGANSRLWGGIHFSFDRDAGLTAGEQVAQWELAQSAFSAVPEPGTWTIMIAGLGLVGTALRRRRKVLQPARRGASGEIP